MFRLSSEIIVRRLRMSRVLQRISLYTVSGKKTSRTFSIVNWRRIIGF